MHPKLTRILLVHLPIAATYMLLTGGLFLLLQVPDPTLIGVVQGACVGLHLGLTLLLSIRWHLPRSLVMGHLATLFLVIALLQLTNRPYWTLLWQLRHL